MPKLHRKSYHDTLATLPDWQEGEINFNRQIAFIAAAGFEERCIKGIMTYLPKISNALILKYEHNKTDNLAQEQFFENELKAHNISRVNLNVNGDLYIRVKDWISTLGTIPIIIDISSLASFAFFPIIEAVFESCGSNEVHLLYTAAESYQPSQAEFETFYSEVKNGDMKSRPEICQKFKIQSSGIDKRYFFDSYQGSRDSVPGHAIVLPNFSYDRVIGMIHFCHSTGVPDDGFTWIIGEPQRPSHKWVTGALERLYECNNGSVIKIDTLDYKRVMITLNDLWETNKNDKNMFIADLGSKSHHFGVYLFLRTHQDVGLILSEPREFSGASYSKGSYSTHILSIGSIEPLRQMLPSWKSIDFIWDTGSDGAH